MKNSCARCLMPFSKDKGKRESKSYCSYCFKEGELVYKGTDLKEFQRYCYEAMVNRGINKYLARFYTFLIRFAPDWRKKN